MKKSIAFIGAFFMGALAFAQVSKTDTINKTASRKVLNNDMKNIPPDAEPEAQSGEIKGNFHQKMKVEQNVHIKISDQSARDIKGSITQKGRDRKLSTTSDESIPQKGREGKLSTTEKQNFTVKMTNADKKVAKDTIQKTAKSSDIFLKITDVKGE